MSQSVGRSVGRGERRNNCLHYLLSTLNQPRPDGRKREEDRQRPSERGSVCPLSVPMMPDWMMGRARASKPNTLISGWAETMGNNDVYLLQPFSGRERKIWGTSESVPGIYRVMTVMIMSRERRGIWHLSDVQDSARSDSRNAEQGTERQNPLRRFNK